MKSIWNAIFKVYMVLMSLMGLSILILIVVGVVSGNGAYLETGIKALLILGLMNGLLLMFKNKLNRK